MELLESFLRDQRMRLAVAEVAGRRTDQLGNFVRVLELRAVDFDHGSRISEQNFRSRFHHSRLARARGPEEQQVPDRPSGRAHAGAKHLV